MQCTAEAHSLQGFLATVTAAVELTLNETADTVLLSDASNRSCRPRAQAQSRLV